MGPMSSFARSSTSLSMSEEAVAPPTPKAPTSSLAEKRAARAKAVEDAWKPNTEAEWDVLNAKSAAIGDEREMCFNVLYDLGLVEKTPNPDDSEDDELMEGQIYVNFDPAAAE